MLGVWVFNTQMYGCLERCMGFYAGCMDLLKEVWIFPWCMGVLRGTDVEMRGTGASSFCVTHQPPQFGVQKEITRCNHFFFLKCTMFSDSWSSMCKLNCKSLEMSPN